jgi:hypothetical protein
MIGRRGHRIAERPCAFHRSRPGAPPRRGARDPPPGTQNQPSGRRRRRVIPEKALGQRRHPPAQTEPNSTRNRITERSRGMTTHITSAGAGCKGSGRRSSCGIVLAAAASDGSGSVP